MEGTMGREKTIIHMFFAIPAVNFQETRNHVLLVHPSFHQAHKAFLQANTTSYYPTKTIKND